MSGLARAVLVVGGLLAVASAAVATDRPAEAQTEPLAELRSESGPTVLPGLEQPYTVPGATGEFRARDDFTIVVKPPPPPPAPIAKEPPAPVAVRPVEGALSMAGGFGPRVVAGCGACSTNHQGLDFAAATGSSVSSAKAGVVVEAGASGGYGLSVVVRHGPGLLTRYAHLSAITVEAGARVDAGAELGKVGSTGVSTGPHLHFEVVHAGARIDPAAWLLAAGVL